MAESKENQKTRELAAVAERPIFKSQEASSPITGTLPETPRRPPRK